MKIKKKMREVVYFIFFFVIIYLILQNNTKKNKINRVLSGSGFKVNTVDKRARVESTYL